MRCQLCGFEFDEKQMKCHASCALNSYCTVICCPNCGHQSVDESKSRLVKAFQWIFKRTEQPAPAEQQDQPCRLSDLRSGESGMVTSITSKNPVRLERLNVFGVTPGCEVTLMQRHPAFVLRVGFTELSFEREIAEEILVDKLDCNR